MMQGVVFFRWLLLKFVDVIVLRMFMKQMIILGCIFFMFFLFYQSWLLMFLVSCLVSMWMNVCVLVVLCEKLNVVMLIWFMVGMWFVMCFLSLWSIQWMCVLFLFVVVMFNMLLRFLFELLILLQGVLMFLMYWFIVCGLVLLNGIWVNIVSLVMLLYLVFVMFVELLLFLLQLLFVLLKKVVNYMGFGYFLYCLICSGLSVLWCVWWIEFLIGVILVMC